MTLVIPDEIKELVKIYDPYKEGIKLRDDAPQEAREAYERVDKWFERLESRHEY